MAIESVDCLLSALMESAEGISDINFTVGRPPRWRCTADSRQPN